HVRAEGEAAQVDPEAPQEDMLAGNEGVQRLEEEVYVLRESLGEQRVLLERISGTHDRLSTWMVARMGQLMDQIGLRYPRFDGSIFGISHVSFGRRSV
ncbi:hypothetical protein Tco_1133820, partial [Tanacetum coccineum]